jgi:hypothetical protein
MTSRTGKEDRQDIADMAELPERKQGQDSHNMTAV